jgi:hypothetical protein
MKYNTLSRRHMLQGAGSTLLLPLLPSLMPRAHAQAMRLPKFFVSTWVGHGGLSLENAYPIDSTVTLNTSQLYAAQGTEPAHSIVSGRLVNLKKTHAQTASARAQVVTDFDNGAARFSPLIGSFVPDSLLAKMNVLRGIDFLTWGGHTRGFLGNFVNRDGGATDTGLADVKIPTIDYVISQSANFYSAGERILLKAPSLAITPNELSSYPSGNTVAGNPFKARKLGDIFQMIFTGVNTVPGQIDPKVTVVDRMKADFDRMISPASTSGRRISRDDKVRLGEYVQSVQDISNRMRSMMSAGCMVPTLAANKTQLYSREGEFDWEWPTVPMGAAATLAEQKEALSLANMMLVAAFQCGTTRIAIKHISALSEQWDPLYFPDMITAGRSDAHDMVFHGHAKADRQQLILKNQRFQFENAYVDLVKKMEATQIVPGVSMLDQSAVYWSSECGFETHNAKSVPTIIAGAAGGYFSTGNYVDYTHRTRQIRAMYGNMWTAGVPQNRLLANLCQSMGLTTNEYELSDAAYGTKFPSRAGKVPGYGDPALGLNDNKVPYLPQQIADMSVKLPIVTT